MVSHKLLSSKGDMKICDYCSNQFEPIGFNIVKQRFCSTSCSNLWWGAKRSRAEALAAVPHSKICDWCGVEFHLDINRRGYLGNWKKRRWCSLLCKRRGNWSEYHSELYDGDYAVYRAVLYQLIYLEEKPCAKCGEVNKARLQVDHITPRALGGTNDSENLQVLCLKCHGPKTQQDIIHINAVRSLAHASPA